MNYSSLEDVYGTPFHQRVPVTHQRKDAKEVPLEDKMKGKSKSAVESAVESVKDSIGFDTDPVTENFRMEAPPPPVKQREVVRYERPATQDLILYIATGIFFLFTFDTFVMLGKSMRKH